MGFWLLLAFTVVSFALNLLLAPKIKTPKPDAATDLEDPVAEAGKPIPVVFGTVTVKGLNVLWFGDKRVKTIKVSV